MRYEFKKMGIAAVIVMCLCVIANAWLFYRHCTNEQNGYSQIHIAQKYDTDLSVLEMENAVLNLRAEQFLFGGDSRDDSLLTGDVFDELKLNVQIFSLRSYDYSHELHKMLSEIDYRLNSGNLGQEGSFLHLSQLRMRKIYSRFLPLVVENAFSGSVELLDTWQPSHIFFLVFGFLAGPILLLQERRSGLLALLHPTKRGHGYLYCQKFSTMSLCVLFGFVLIYGSNIVISGQLMGFGDLSRPIQSVPEFSSCPLNLNVRGYLFFSLGSRLLWGWAICSLFFFFCSLCRSVSTLFLIVGVIGLGVFGLSESSNLWFRSIGETFLGSIPTLYRQARLLNLFGRPVLQLPVVLLLLLCVLLLSFFAGWLIFIRTSAVAGTDTIRILKPHFLFRHCSVFFHEGQKILLSQRALILLMIFAGLQFLCYKDGLGSGSEWEYYYKQYSDILSGEPCQKSSDYLVEEQQRIDAVYEKIQEYSKQAQELDLNIELLLSSLRDQVRGEQAFHYAKNQYETLTHGQQYVYSSGYRKLFDTEGKRERLLNCVKLLIFQTLAYSAVFAVEQETGVEILQHAAGHERRIRRSKWFFCGIVGLLSFFLCYAPQMIVVARELGFPQVNAAANSLQIFSGWPDRWTIRQVLMFQGIGLFLGHVATGALILYFSKKTGSQVTTIVLGLGILCLPTLLLWILL